MPARRPVVFSEKEFYLDEFRGRTLLFAVHHDGPGERLRELGEITRELLLNDTRVLILLGGDATRGRIALRAFERPLTTAPATFDAARRSACGLPIKLSPAGDGESPVLVIDDAECEAARISEELLIRIWGIIRSVPLFVGLCSRSSPGRLAAFAQRIGVRLRVHKLVIVDPQGAVAAVGESKATLSFMDEAVTEQLLQTGEAEWAGLGARRSMLDAIRQGLLGGISSVNVCSLDGLARELFTYEGSGTLFTREDYCRVERLALDDFHQVQKLLEKGHREGYLKARNADEIGRILVSGYGATIGRHHLAGICSLQTEQYTRARAGEIAGLYTITRFKGEGVGVKLVERMKEEGRGLGLVYLFACTTQERVGQFFERQGFTRVSETDVPAEKWAGYEDARRKRIAIYRCDL